MELKENLKLGLLGIIAVTLIINTFFMGDSVNTASSPTTIAPVNQSNKIAPQIAPQIAPAPSPIANPVQVPVGPTTTMAYSEEAHNFGNIKQDTENEHVFKFTNTGTEPLIISNAKGSCGCTVPQYPTEPIAPGESSEIKVVYKPGKQKGSQTKTVTVTANTTPAQTLLKISADVEEVVL
jgi:hypothetical protein